MASLKGLITILGFTAIAGIGGLYILEELCNGKKNIKTVELPKYYEDQNNDTDMQSLDEDNDNNDNNARSDDDTNVIWDSSRENVDID